MSRIIITCTSFPGRINNLPKVIGSILSGKVLPHKIVINLCKSEFPELELSLPPDLLELINKSGLIKLNWVVHNTKVYKKLFPTVDLYPDDAIMSIDDDWCYPPDMLDEFIKVYNLNNGSFNISGSRILYEDYKPLGVYTMYKPGVLKDYRYYLTFEDIQLNRDDEFIYAFLSSRSEHFIPVTLDAPYPVNIENQISTFPSFSGNLIDYYKTRIPRYCEITSKLASRVFKFMNGSTEVHKHDLNYLDFEW